MVAVVAAAMATVAGVHIRNGMRFQAALARFDAYVDRYYGGKLDTSVSGVVEESRILMETECECRPTRWGKISALTAHIARSKHFIEEDEYEDAHSMHRDRIVVQPDARLMLEQSERELAAFTGAKSSTVPAIPTGTQVGK